MPAFRPMFKWSAQFTSRCRCCRGARTSSMIWKVHSFHSECRCRQWARASAILSTLSSALQEYDFESLAPAWHRRADTFGQIHQGSCRQNRAGFVPGMQLVRTRWVRERIKISQQCHVLRGRRNAATCGPNQWSLDQRRFAHSLEVWWNGTCWEGGALCGSTCETA